jgi:SagB-type dehydrogenase family enzyme
MKEKPEEKSAHLLNSWRGLFAALQAAQAGEDGLSVLREIRQESNEERRSLFRVFGEVIAGSRCPASRLYHLHSRLPLSAPLAKAAEIEALTLSLDYKRYPDAPCIQLPEFSDALSTSLCQAIEGRRSVREFSRQVMTLVQASDLLHSGCGITRQGLPPYRAAPSAGALFGIETYLIAFRVAELDSCLYHYCPLPHQLEQLRPLKGPQELWPALAPGFKGVSPPVGIALTARLDRLQAKYGERAYRFVHLEAGHIAQNFLLASSALGLGAVPVGGFVDEELDSLLSTPNRNVLFSAR